jgi:hypothetical protein
MVEVVVNYSGSIPTGTSTILADGTIPVGTRPVSYNRRGVVYIGGTSYAGLAVTTAGGVLVDNGTTTTGTSCLGAVTYIKG